MILKLCESRLKISYNVTRNKGNKHRIFLECNSSRNLEKKKNSRTICCCGTEQLISDEQKKSIKIVNSVHSDHHLLKKNMIRCASLLLFLAILVSAQTAKPLVSPNKNAAVQNSYSQSIKHFLKDLKNMAGGFVANRMDKLQNKHHQAKEKIRNMFRKLVASFKKKS